MERNSKAVCLLLHVADEGKHARRGGNADLAAVGTNKGACAVAVILDHTDHGKIESHCGEHFADRCGVDTDDHLLPFEGAIPMDEVAKDLAESGYQGTLMLEIGRLIVTHTYDEMSEEEYMDRAAAAVKKLYDLVESYR